MSLSIADIVHLFETKGHAQYDGEPVTQLEHALQSAHCAEQAGSSSALISLYTPLTRLQMTLLTNL